MQTGSSEAVIAKSVTCTWHHTYHVRCWLETILSATSLTSSAQSGRMIQNITNI